MVSANVAMKHLTRNQFSIVVFQMIQHAQGKAKSWIVQMVKSSLWTKSVMFKIVVLWISGVFLQYLPVVLLLVMFIVLKEKIFLKFVMSILQMIRLEKIGKILMNLLNNIVALGMQNLVNPAVMYHFIINATATRKQMIWKQVHNNTWFLIFVSYL